jgi:hypothetical protein
VDDVETGERWVAGPRLPTEPRPPFRYRGAVGLLVALLVTIGLTLVVAPTFLDVQDPTFGDAGDGQRLDDAGDDATFERQRSG